MRTIIIIIELCQFVCLSPDFRLDDGIKNPRLQYSVFQILSVIGSSKMFQTLKELYFGDEYRWVK